MGEERITDFEIIMNILILNWRCPKHPNAGGAEIATFEHARYWVKKGNNVTWFSSSFKGNNLSEEVLDGVKIIRRSNQTLGVHIYAFFWYIFSYKQQFDIIIDQFHGIPFFTPLYVRVKKLAFIHEVTKEVWKKNQLPYPLNIIPATFGELCEKIIFKFFYRNIKFMTVSQSTKKDLIDFGIREENINVIYNGIRYIKPQFVKKERNPTIMYLGALASDKGISNILQIFEALNSKHKKWNFWIAGKGSDDYVKLIHSKKYIKYFGFVSEKKKFELFKRAHIFLNLSIREGWGLTNIEANSQGTPVIGFNVAGTKDSVVHNKTGVLVEKNNLKMLEKQIEKLVQNKKNYGELSRNSVEWSKKFNWEKSAKISYKLLLEI